MEPACVMGRLEYGQYAFQIKADIILESIKFGLPSLASAMSWERPLGLSRGSGPRQMPQKSIFSAHFSKASILILET